MEVTWRGRSWPLNFNKERTMIRMLLAATSFFVACVPPYANAQAGDALVARGQKFAELTCAACHVVSASQQFAPILRDPAPSFDSIANRPTTTEQSLRAFLTTTHSTISNPNGMPNPQLADYQIKEVISYILSLRRK